MNCLRAQRSFILGDTKLFSSYTGPSDPFFWKNQNNNNICGGASAAKLISEGSEMDNLKRKFSVVRAVCETCKLSGRQPRYDPTAKKKKSNQN